MFDDPTDIIASEDPLDALTWWFTGGVALIAWTGIALLLTSA